MAIFQDLYFHIKCQKFNGNWPWICLLSSSGTENTEVRFITIDDLEFNFSKFYLWILSLTSSCIPKICKILFFYSFSLNFVSFVCNLFSVPKRNILLFTSKRSRVFSTLYSYSYIWFKMLFDNFRLSIL